MADDKKEYCKTADDCKEIFVGNCRDCPNVDDGDDA